MPDPAAEAAGGDAPHPGVVERLSLGWGRRYLRPRPRRSFLVVGAQRTGSNLLCRSLIATGHLGHPAEFFQPAEDALWRARWGLTGADPSYARFFHAALRAGSDRHRTFGAKLLWHQERALADRLAGTGAPVLDTLFDRFPSLRLVHLERRDKVRAAISHWRALASGQWIRLAGEPIVAVEVEPDLAQISRFHQDQHDAAAFWQAALDDGRPGIPMSFEDLVADRWSAVEAVADLLGVTRLRRWPAWLERRVIPVAQGDEVNDEVAERWARATGGCEACGHPG